MKTNQLKVQPRKSLSIWDKKSVKQLSSTAELQDVVFLHIEKASEFDLDKF